MTTKRKRSSNEEIPFKQLKLKDKSSSIKVALWRDLATTPIEKGNYVHLKIFYKTSTFDSKKEDQVPVLYSDISSSEEDIPEEDNNHVGQIYGIQNIYTYR